MPLAVALGMGLNWALARTRSWGGAAWADGGSHAQFFEAQFGAADGSAGEVGPVDDEAEVLHGGTFWNYY